MARRSGAPALQLAHSETEASEVEVDESQRLNALSSLLQTPKTNLKELQSFDTKVADDQQELKILLQQRKCQAEKASMRRRNELTKAILDALQTPNRPLQGTTPTLRDTSIARNAVFKSVAHVLTASEHLIGEYDRLEKAIASTRDAEPEGVAETWVEEVEKTARLLRIGAEAAIRNVKKVLGAEVSVDGTEVSVDGTEDRGLVEQMFGAEKTELNYELKRSLQCAERGVKKMVQGLPEGE